MPSTPSTPPPQPQQLKYTPGNQGSATVSEYVEKYTPKAPYVHPWIHRDIKSHQTCRFDTMLKALLARCSPEEADSDLDDLLKNCLEVVLPLCNEDSKLREYLSDYCEDMPSETARYGPFVELCNYALHVLGSKVVPKLPPSDTIDEKDRILFHVSDRSPINCSHGQRKPDVLLVPFSAAVASAQKDHQHDQWIDVIMNTAIKPPHKAFSWESSLLPLEFKLAKRSLESPPKSYEIKEPKDVPPIRTSEDGLSEDGLSNSTIATYSTGLTNGASASGAGTSEAATSTSIRSTTSKPTSSRASNKSKISSEPTSNGGQNRRSDRLREKAAASGSQHSAGTGSKRPAEGLTSESSGKRQKIEEPTVSLHVNIQTALYGAEILSHSSFSSSAMAMVIIDSKLHLWWYDRQGAIQTHGLDFIEDLPHFLVLLLALQRLPPKGWGKGNMLEPSFRIGGQYGEMDIKPGQRVVQHWGIQGRATNILQVEATSYPPHITPKLEEQLQNQGMVAKLLWVQSQRVLESVILEEIPKRMFGISEEDRAAVEGHIPDMIASKIFPEYETRKIRKDLGIAAKDIENRVLILFVFRQLKPITELEGDEFFRAWWDCVLCHRVLWKLGIRHRDISAANLMYYRHQGRVMGVLNDYDLSTLTPPGCDQGPTGTDRTGTLPFMALDLLQPEALAGEVEHQYRHDFESFIWVLTWIAHRYQGGEEIPKAPFTSWITDHQQCRKEKLADGSDLVTEDGPVPAPTPSHESVWLRCGKVLLHAIFMIRFGHKKFAGDDDYFNQMKNELERSGKDLSVNSFNVH
ncbi:hypothetical protein FRC02_002828 [Tulasnella sp. 418]|nr:hypothetical protein FRC02_002828 [Tulasnella sp. 418]